MADYVKALMAQAKEAAGPKAQSVPNVRKKYIGSGEDAFDYKGNYNEEAQNIEGDCVYDDSWSGEC